MARGTRSEVRRDAPARLQPRPPDRDRETAKPDLRVRGLKLPRTETREPVHMRDRVYHLRGSETRTLATVGAFRAVRVADLEPRAGSMWNDDVRHLAEQGLIERKTVVINHRPTEVVALTRQGKALLQAHQEASSDGRQQTYHAGFVKPRELAHDAQLLRVYKTEAARIQEEGGRVSRVVLDYELKRDYQQFLNRAGRPEDSSLEEDVHSFAGAHRLPVVDGHLELPDLRIEYEMPDGRLEYRDVELVTEHYSRAQLAGKSQAGFRLYRASGAGKLGAGSDAGRAGATPIDPHNLEWLG
jgi:hypothetical protein